MWAVCCGTFGTQTTLASLSMLRQTYGMSGLSVLGVDSSSSLEDLALGSTSTLYQQIVTQIQYVICNCQCLEPWGKLEDKKERLFTISLILLMFHLNFPFLIFFNKNYSVLCQFALQTKHLFSCLAC